MQKGTTTNRCTPATRTPEFGKAKDLRRRHGREASEALVSRAAYLPDSDRQLVLAVFEEGKSVVELASLMKQPVRILRTRVRRLVERITSPVFAFVALNLDQWPVPLKSVADACVFRGLTIKEASVELHISYYNVRRRLDLIRTMLETTIPGRTTTPATLHLTKARCVEQVHRSRSFSLDDNTRDDDDTPDQCFEPDDPPDPDTDEREIKSVRHSSTTCGRLCHKA